MLMSSQQILRLQKSHTGLHTLEAYRHIPTYRPGLASGRHKAQAKHRCTYIPLPIDVPQTSTNQKLTGQNDVILEYRTGAPNRQRYSFIYSIDCLSPVMDLVPSPIPPSVKNDDAMVKIEARRKQTHFII